ncbi:hypothetical protein NSP_18050 [Nodularia spumigena CCY9414]|nr:hypothetical protein NSP_18050 [Nodularia spumigena CCY9414]
MGKASVRTADAFHLKKCQANSNGSNKGYKTFGMGLLL